MKSSILLAIAALLVCGAAPATQPDANKFEKEIVAFEAADRKEAPAKDAVIFLGSSTIKKWTTLAADFPGVAVINRGFGGSMIPDSVRYAPRILVAARPRLIVFYAGDNDLGAGHTPQQVLADFQALVQIIRRDLPETRLLFISIKPSPKRWSLIDNIRETNCLVREYVATDPKLGYIDTFPMMLRADGQPRDELYVADKLHMNAEGYKIWAKVVAPRLSSNFDER